MGAISPVPFANDEFIKRIEDRLLNLQLKVFKKITYHTKVLFSLEL